jgi:hypothetical protein
MFYLFDEISLSETNLTVGLPLSNLYFKNKQKNLGFAFIFYKIFYYLQQKP